MEFVDDEHEKFWEEKNLIMQKYGKTDVYYKSIVYTLGICETTRSNFDKIFSIENGEINIDSINSAFQTGTSEKVTRMAFSLWNRCNYDSEKDRQKGKVSEYYNPSEIFCCSYAPYFVEALKIRYPEYFRVYKNNRTIKVNDTNEKESKNNYGIYVRSGIKDKFLVNMEVNDKVKDLLELARKSDYNVTEIYIDEGFSGKVEARVSLQKLLNDMSTGKINGVIVESLEQLVREDFTTTEKFLEQIKDSGAEVVTVQNGKLQNFFEFLNDMNKDIVKDINKLAQAEKRKKIAQSKKKIKNKDNESR